MGETLAGELNVKYTDDESHQSGVPLTEGIATSCGHFSLTLPSQCVVPGRT